MPLVFVHGVTVRTGGDYASEVKDRDALFQSIVLSDSRGVPYARPPRNPYWGGHAARFRWNQAAVPEGTYATLGAPDPLLATLLMESPRSEGDGGDDAILSDVARVSLPDAVDLLLAAALDNAGDPGRGRLSAFAREAAAYAARNPRPGWAVPGQSNDDFVDRLIREVESPAALPATSTSAATAAPVFQPLGFNDTLNWLLGGADRVRTAATEWVGSKKDQVSQWVGSKKDEVDQWVKSKKEEAVHRVSRELVDRYRSSLHATLSTFVGDVLIYINECGDAKDPGAIPSIILGDLESAFAERTDTDPLIVVGHSMGGVILYDLLSGFLPTRRPDLKVDVLVTVASQVGLFEELKQFRLRDDTVPGPGGGRMPRPANVGRWVNIFDKVDVLSFAAGKIFDGVEDYDFSSETDTFSAHSAYFLRASFYQRLRDRLFPPGV